MPADINRMKSKLRLPFSDSSHTTIVMNKKLAVANPRYFITKGNAKSNPSVIRNKRKADRDSHHGITF